MTEAWAGALSIGQGYALVDGRIGRNVQHRHLAFQLTVAREGAVELIEHGRVTLAARAILVAPNVPHCIGPVGLEVRSLYVEPMLPLGRRFMTHVGVDGAVDAGPDLATLTLQWRSQTARETISPYGTIEQGGRSRAVRLLELVEAARDEEGPGDWALALGISESRLRAFCVETFGVPPVRLRQWNRLKAAARLVASGAALADAAAAAGYADQSHFTRQLTRWFGVSPGRGLASLRIDVEP